MLQNVRLQISQLRTRVAARPELALAWAALLTVGLALRIALADSARPALLNSTDATAYLRVAALGDWTIDPLHPPGYAWLLEAGLWLTNPTGVILLQHLAAVTVCLVFVWRLSRLGVRPWLVLCTAAVSLIALDQIQFEHSFLSEAPFGVIFYGGLAIALWIVPALGRPGGPARRTLVAAVAVGMLLAAASVVRTIGWLAIPVVVVVLAHPLLRRRPNLRDAWTPIAVALGVIVVAVPYLAVRHEATGRASLSTTGGWSRYARVAQIADCTRTTTPAGTAALCETTPTPQRPGVRQYWFYPKSSPAIRTFGGFPNANARLGAFGSAVVRDQPLDVAAMITRDTVRHVWPSYARRRYGAVSGPAAELDVSARFTEIEAAQRRRLRDLGVPAGGRSSASLSFLGEVQQVVRVQPWLLLLLIVTSVTGLLLRGTRNKASNALLLGVGLAQLVGGTALQLYNPRYDVPVELAFAGAAAIGAEAILARRGLRRRARDGWAWSTGALRRLREAAAGVPTTLWAILVLGALGRLLSFVVIHPALADRWAVANDLQQTTGEVWTGVLGEPGVPVLLRSANRLGLDLPSIALANHLLGLVAAVLAYAVARRLGARVAWSALAAAVVVLDPTRVAAEHALRPTSLTTALLLGMALVLLRSGSVTPSRAGLVALCVGALAATLALPPASAIVVAALAAVVLVARTPHRDAYRPAVGVVLVSFAAVLLLAVDRWDATGGRIRLDPAAPTRALTTAAEDGECRPESVPPGPARSACASGAGPAPAEALTLALFSQDSGMPGPRQASIVDASGRVEPSWTSQRLAWVQPTAAWWADVAERNSAASDASVMWGRPLGLDRRVAVRPAGAAAWGRAILPPALLGALLAVLAVSATAAVTLRFGGRAGVVTGVGILLVAATTTGTESLVVAMIGVLAAPAAALPSLTKVAAGRAGPTGRRRRRNETPTAPTRNGVGGARRVDVTE